MTIDYKVQSRSKSLHDWPILIASTRVLTLIVLWEVAEPMPNKIKKNTHSKMVKEGIIEKVDIKRRVYNEINEKEN